MSVKVCHQTKPTKDFLRRGAVREAEAEQARQSDFKFDFIAIFWAKAGKLTFILIRWPL